MSDEKSNLAKFFNGFGLALGWSGVGGSIGAASLCFTNDIETVRTMFATGLFAGGAAAAADIWLRRPPFLNITGRFVALAGVAILIDSTIKDHSQNNTPAEPDPYPSKSLKSESLAATSPYRVDYKGQVISVPSPRSLG